jgi:predicted nucleic acid-binding protein
MILVYSLLQGHPAATACEQLLRAHAGWFTSPWVLIEAKAVLTKVYGEDPALVTQKLAQVAHGPVVLVDLARTDVITVLQLADTHALDLTDAVLLYLVHRHGARFLTSAFPWSAPSSASRRYRPWTPPSVRRSALGKPPMCPPRACRACSAASTSG